jgi:transformation/transcription domain-associated protein
LFGHSLRLTHFPQIDFSTEALVNQAISAAKVLQVVAAEQPDSWYTANASVLQKLVIKGILCEDSNLQDALHPIFDKILSLFPLPESVPPSDNEQAEFHRTVWELSNESNMMTPRPNVRGVILVAKSIIRTTPE